MFLDQLSAFNIWGDIILQKSTAVDLARVVGESTIGWRAPVVIVDLEDSIISALVVVWWSNSGGVVVTFVSCNANVVWDISSNNSKPLQLFGQRATSENFSHGGSSKQGQSQNEK